MKYRLKKEATVFFKQDLATLIADLSFWFGLQVDKSALEEVEETYISFGIKTSESGSSLCGWDGDKGSHFHFTINFPSVKFCEHDKFSNGRVTRELMDVIQNKISDFYSQFVTETK